MVHVNILLLILKYHCIVPKKSIPTPWKVIGNSQGEGGGSLKAKFLEAMYENKLEFPGGRGAKQKNLLSGEYG